MNLVLVEVGCPVRGTSRQRARTTTLSGLGTPCVNLVAGDGDAPRRVVGRPARALTGCRRPFLGFRESCADELGSPGTTVAPGPGVRLPSVLVLLLSVGISGCYLSHRLDDAPDASAHDTSRPDADASLELDSERPDTWSPNDTDVDMDVDVDAGLQPFICPDGRVAEGDAVALDLLFVIDDSGSMLEEQASLRRTFSRMLDMLVEGDLDDDGVADVPPVEQLHLAVTSVNQGSPGGEICNVRTRLAGGNFARFRASGCESRSSRYFCHERGDDPETTRTAFSWTADLGTSTCVIEQPFECALQGLAFEDEGFRFVAGVGRGDHGNLGFRRPGALLGIVVITDEDDCSVADRRFYDLESGVYPFRGLDQRCNQYPEALQPIDRFITGLQTLSGFDDAGLVVATIAGVPTDLVGEPLDRVLSDPRMSLRDDPEQPALLAPACESAFGRATPARRIARMMDGLGAQGSLHSICEGDLAPAIAQITRRLGEVIYHRACER